MVKQCFPFIYLSHKIALKSEVSFCSSKTCFFVFFFFILLLSMSLHLLLNNKRAKTSLVKQNRNKQSWNKECLVFVPFYRKYPQGFKPHVSIVSKVVVFTNLGPCKTFSCPTSLTFCCVVHKYQYSIDSICYLPLEELINSLLLQNEHYSFFTLPAVFFFTSFRWIIFQLFFLWSLQGI